MTDIDKIKELREKDNFKPRVVEPTSKRKRTCKGCEVRRPRSR